MPDQEVRHISDFDGRRNSSVDAIISEIQTNSKNGLATRIPANIHHKVRQQCWRHDLKLHIRRDHDDTAIVWAWIDV